MAAATAATMEATAAAGATTTEPSTRSATTESRARASAAEAAWTAPAAEAATKAAGTAPAKTSGTTTAEPAWPGKTALPARDTTRAAEALAASGQRPPTGGAATDAADRLAPAAGGTDSAALHLPSGTTRDTLLAGLHAAASGATSLASRRTILALAGLVSLNALGIGAPGLASALAAFRLPGRHARSRGRAGGTLAASIAAPARQGITAGVASAPASRRAAPWPH